MAGRKGRCGPVAVGRKSRHEPVVVRRKTSDGWEEDQRTRQSGSAGPHTLFGFDTFALHLLVVVGG
jgi:hypothetical protein